MHCTSINYRFILGIRFKQKKLIDCAFEYYLKHQMKDKLTIVRSGYPVPKEDTWENRPAKSSTKCFNSTEIQPPSLQQETEADVRVIPHLCWTLNFAYELFVVLTNDTDVLVLLLLYCAIFLKMKMKNLYIKIGIETTTRYLPVHEFSNIPGKKQC